MNNAARWYVYFASDSDWAMPSLGIKIGASSSPHSRVSRLGKNVSLLSVIACESKSEAFSLERRLHRQHEADRIVGEWFGATFDVMKTVESGTTPALVTDSELTRAFSLPGKLDARMQAAAEADRRSVSNWLRGVIEAALEQRG